MGNDSESGIAANDEWKEIVEHIKSIQNSEDGLLDMTKYLDILSRVESQITIA